MCFYGYPGIRESKFPVSSSQKNSKTHSMSLDEFMTDLRELLLLPCVTRFDGV